jgi:tetratricopeptide (TPR) repeat protein
MVNSRIYIALCISCTISVPALCQKQTYIELTNQMHRDPDSAEVYKKRAEMSARMFDLKGAEDDYTHALRLNPNDADAYRKRAEIHIRKMEKRISGAAEEEHQFYKKLPITFKDSDVQSYLEASKQRELMRGKENEVEFKAAMKDLDAAQRIDPKNTQTYRMRAGFLSRRKDYNGAEDALNTALRIDNRDIKSYSDRASVRRRLGNYKGAEEDWNAVLRLKPESRYYTFRAHLRQEQGNFEGAAEDYRQALKLEPYDTNLASSYWELRNKAGHDSEAFMNRAEIAPRVSAHKKIDYKGQIADITESLRINPKQPDAYRQRAEAYKQQGELKKAIEDYTQSLKELTEYLKDYKGPHRLELQAVELGLYMDRAKLYESLGEYKHAIDDCNQLIETLPLEFALSAATYRTELYKKMGDEKGFHEAMRQEVLLLNQLQTSLHHPR